LIFADGGKATSARRASMNWREPTIQGWSVGCRAGGLANHCEARCQPSSVRRQPASGGGVGPFPGSRISLASQMSPRSRNSSQPIERTGHLRRCRGGGDGARQLGRIGRPPPPHQNAKCGPPHEPPRGILRATRSGQRS
jgi:hypothetical protein